MKGGPTVRTCGLPSAPVCGFGVAAGVGATGAARGCRLAPACPCGCAPFGRGRALAALVDRLRQQLGLLLGHDDVAVLDGVVVEMLERVAPRSGPARGSCTTD